MKLTFRKGHRFYLLQHDRFALVELLYVRRNGDIAYAPISKTGRVLDNLTTETTTAMLQRMFDYGFASEAADVDRVFRGRLALKPMTIRELSDRGISVCGYADGNDNGTVKLVKIIRNGHTEFVPAKIEWHSVRGILSPKTVKLYPYIVAQ